MGCKEKARASPGSCADPHAFSTPPVLRCVSASRTKLSTDSTKTMLQLTLNGKRMKTCVRAEQTEDDRYQESPQPATAAAHGAGARRSPPSNVEFVCARTGWQDMAVACAVLLRRPLTALAVAEKTMFFFLFSV